MEIVISAAVAAVVAAALAWLVRGRTRHRRATASPVGPAPEGRGSGLVGDQELRERRAEIVRLEERILQREESLEARLADVAHREQSLADRERNAERLREEVRAARQEHLR